MKAGAGSTAAIRRILVALDGSDHSLAALEAALCLSARLQAELEALFVEDIDLLRMADLPCARVLSLSLRQAERTDRERMERQLRLQATRARQRLEMRAGALGVRARFRAVRGDVCAEILAAAAEADILSLGRAGHSRLPWAGRGSTLEAALRCGRPLLVAERESPVGQGILAIYDGSEASDRALELATDLAHGNDWGLHVLLLAASPQEAEGLAAQVRACVVGSEVPLALSCCWTDPAVAALVAARRERPALLVVGGDLAGRLLDALNCPLLVVP